MLCWCTYLDRALTVCLLSRVPSDSLSNLVWLKTQLLTAEGSEWVTCEGPCQPNAFCGSRKGAGSLFWSAVAPHGAAASPAPAAVQCRTCRQTHSRTLWSVSQNHRSVAKACDNRIRARTRERVLRCAPRDASCSHQGWDTLPALSAALCVTAVARFGDRTLLHHMSRQQLSSMCLFGSQAAAHRGEKLLCFGEGTAPHSLQGNRIPEPSLSSAPAPVDTAWAQTGLLLRQL